MKICCLQMDIQFGRPRENFLHAEELIRSAMKESPDVLVLPETWNTGFFPKEDLTALSDKEGKEVTARIGGLAKEYHVNIVAGSVSNVKNSKVFNTAMVFDRSGSCIADYDKTHLFSPMGENDFYSHGDHLCRFELDGVRCGIIICYDLRFPELTRTLSIEGIDMMFVVSQWPAARIFHLQNLVTARAIENQMFVACCNSCGKAGDTVFGGRSSIVDPLGKVLAFAEENEEIISACCDVRILNDIRNTIPVFRDRRPEIYHI